jgi:hypothetical protein
VNVVPKPSPEPDPSWWDDPELRPDLARQDVAALYRFLQRRGWSQNQIGQATGQSQPEVSMILKGRRVTSYEVLARVADGLAMPRGYLGLSGCVSCPVTVDPAVDRTGEVDAGGDDPVHRRELLGAVAAVAAGGSVDWLDRWFPATVTGIAPVPARVGAADVAQVRAITGQLRVLDKRCGGGAVLDAGRGFAGWAQRMLGSRYHDATGRDLRLALADLHGLLGWAASDAGRRTEATRHMVRALALARDADEPGLVADVLSQMGRVHVHWRQPVEALRLSQLGFVADPAGRCPATTALLHVNQAWALALSGDARGVAEALARADHELSRANPATLPTWGASAVMLLESAYQGTRARVYCALAQHAEHRGYATTAAEQAQAALDAYDGTRAWRSTILDRISLATALLRAGERDAGLASGHEVVSQVGTLRSARAAERLAEVGRAAGRYAGHPDAHHLRTLIAARTG